ncbi:Putative uncharacterized protein [Staphylococcus xylosus]|nr:Putative uncharacterized protein [Staphylococcus xylosus]
MNQEKILLLTDQTMAELMHITLIKMRKSYTLYNQNSDQLKKILNLNLFQ